MEDKQDKKNWAEMSDDEGDEQLNENKEAAKEEGQKNHVIKQKSKAADVPPPVKGVKNSRGDYIVSTINIIDNVVKKEKTEDEEESDTESEGYGDEDDAQEQEQQVEETKEETSKYKFTKSNGVSAFAHFFTVIKIPNFHNVEPQEKQLSKKEKQAQEEAELEALLADLGVKEEAQKKEEKKEEAPKAAPAGEANSKNKKKKDKKKAKDAEKKEENKEEAKAAIELTPEERAAAVKAAMSKRGAVQ